MDAEGGVTGVWRNAFGEAYQTIEYANTIDPNTPNAAVADLRASAGAVSAKGFDRVTQSTFDRRGLLRTSTLVGTQLGNRTSTGALETRLANAQTRTQYDGAGNAVQVLNLLLDSNGAALETGTETLNFYDQLGRLVATTNGYGYGSDTRYDALGNAVQTTRHANAFAISVSAPSNGQPYQRYSLAGGAAASADDQTTTTQYDALGRAIRVRDALNSLLTNAPQGMADRYLSYDAAGRVAKQWQAYRDSEGWRNTLSLFSYDKVGQQTATSTLIQRQRSDALTYAVEGATYNAFGEITQKVLQEMSGNGIYYSALTQQNWYDAGGRVWKSWAGGTTKLYWYDLQDHITASFTSTADTAGRNLASFNAPQDIAAYNGAWGLSQGVSRTTTTYDRLGRATAQASSGATRSSGVVATSASQGLDRWGNTLGATKNGTERLRYRYDAGNRVISEVQVANVVWSATGTSSTRDVEKRIFYDAWGHNIGNIDGEGNTNAAVYDSRGRMTYEYHADGGVVSYGYDGLDRMVTKLDEVLRTYRYSYDRADHEVGRWVSDAGNPNPTHSLGSSTYDELGRKSSDTTGEDAASWGQTRRYDYDARGLMWRSTDALSKSTLSWYDLGGRKRQETDANGLITTWGYDPATGQLTSHKDIGDATYSYTYNQLGQLKSQTNTRGQNLVYAYFEDGALRSLTDNYRSSSTVYDYDIDGNRTRETFTQSGTVYRDVTSGYDKQGRLKTASDVAGAGILGVPGQIYQMEIGYDANGNRRRVWGNATYRYETQHPYDGNTVDQGATALDEWFSYDSVNRVRIDAGVLVNGVISDVDARGVYEYDKAGRRQQEFKKYAINSYTTNSGYREEHSYDFANRLTRTDRTLLVGAGYSATGGARNEKTISYSNNQQTEVSNAFWYSALNPYRADTTTTGFDFNGRTSSVRNLAQSFTATVANNVQVVASAAIIQAEQSYTYDDVGNVRTLNVTGYAPNSSVGPYTVAPSFYSSVKYYQYSYYRFEGYLERGQSVTGQYRYSSSGGWSNYAPATSSRQYDANGNLVQARRSSFESTWYVTDNAGKIVQKYVSALASWGGNSAMYSQDQYLTTWLPANNFQGTLSAPTQMPAMPANPGIHNVGQDITSTLLMNGEVIGGAIQSTNTYDVYNPYDPYDEYPQTGANLSASASLDVSGLGGARVSAGTLALVVAQEGDTAANLAQRYYGDSALWYVIAEANGLGAGSGATLTAGQSLKIPQVTRSSNTASSFAVYEPAKLIGSVGADVGMPPPPPASSGGCGVVGTIIVVA
ncbi:hypothetical protein DBR42_23950, partial [Pelomonas sp. HMWF004]